MQVGSLIIFLEYDRTRRKEVQKQQKEAAERQGIIERARLEREVRRHAAGALSKGRRQRQRPCAVCVPGGGVCLLLTHKRAADTLLCCAMVCLQRLLEENKLQEQMLVQLVQRLDDVEAALQAIQAERTRKSFFGGFIGPKGI